MHKVMAVVLMKNKAKICSLYCLKLKQEKNEIPNAQLEGGNIEKYLLPMETVSASSVDQLKWGLVQRTEWTLARRQCSAV